MRMKEENDCKKVQEYYCKLDSTQVLLVFKVAHARFGATSGEGISHRWRPIGDFAAVMPGQADAVMLVFVTRPETTCFESSSTASEA